MDFPTVKPLNGSRAASVNRWLLVGAVLATLFPIAWFTLAGLLVISGINGGHWLFDQVSVNAVFLAFWVAPALNVIGIGLQFAFQGDRKSLVGFGLCLMFWLLLGAVFSQMPN